MNEQLAVPYQVWFDLSCDDFLALPVSEMTQALSAQLDKEGVEVKTVEAPTAREAVKLAFPKKNLGSDTSSLVNIASPKPSRH